MIPIFGRRTTECRAAIRTIEDLILDGMVTFVGAMLREAEARREAGDPEATSPEADALKLAAAAINEEVEVHIRALMAVHGIRFPVVRASYRVMARFAPAMEKRFAYKAISVITHHVKLSRRNPEPRGTGA